ncbi:hypothetical protein M2S00_03645 [Apilactobacillus sp. TMW 2.2459]|uniref:hypothetical protein n=1 Tax=Apilactobacillus xinyiensis TaxID=2841032 RepID=UPI00200ECF8D|nr:hypothetical protein [Apilactobacillus xinyiensis]MCL0312193.1 hypothetical protein [Apilactobacillus xinyiensis]
MKIYIKDLFSFILGMLLTLSSVIHLMKYVYGSDDLYITMVLFFFAISCFLLGIGFRKNN